MKLNMFVVVSIFIILFSCKIFADDLLVSKTCPVLHKNKSVGILAFSVPWFHNGGSPATYTAKDNDTGIGIEIHFLANKHGLSLKSEKKLCDKYRMLQFRDTSARLLNNEKNVQLDIPKNSLEPFYDALPLEFGHGMHKTPKDTADKPWENRIMRASTIGIYDTPFVSDNYGIEGNDIMVKFETCVVCQKREQIDHILSCGTWGFNREYMGGMTAWSEPEAYPIKCINKPKKEHLDVLKNSKFTAYNHLFNTQ